MIEVIFNPESDSDILIEKILRYKVERNLKDYSLMELIIDYAYEFDIDIDEIGNTLSESKEFAMYFEKDLIQDNYLKGQKPNKLNFINEDDWY